MLLLIMQHQAATRDASSITMSRDPTASPGVAGFAVGSWADSHAINEQLCLPVELLLQEEPVCPLLPCTKVWCGGDVAVMLVAPPGQPRRQRGRDSCGAFRNYNSLWGGGMMPSNDV